MAKKYCVRVVYARTIEASSILEVIDRVENDINVINELDRKSIEVVEVEE